MKTLLGLATATTLFLSSPLAADDLRSLAEDYLALESSKQIMNDMISAESFAAQFESLLPPELTQDREKLLEASEFLASKMLPLVPEMEEAMLEAVIKHFSYEELQALYDFYASDIGASIASKMPAYMADALADINPKIMEISMQSTPEFLEILQGE